MRNRLELVISTRFWSVVELGLSLKILKFSFGLLEVLYLILMNLPLASFSDGCLGGSLSGY